ncbi:hypothetical protein CWATWH0003_5494 [Crocosphaera watsonii WH 0003]|uniref:Uncharacterized protein n=1 Tax=Crocosphaera watsonii WH 0003 TaxID=423471 RepID=G5JDK2_CROWT|nr:hypothetical protein CWATWH0003_5494 [Crocosphaera watsonii WH 0003]
MIFSLPMRWWAKQKLGASHFCRKIIMFCLTGGRGDGGKFIR